MFTSPVPNTMSVVSWSLWPGSMLAGLVCGYGYWRRWGSMLEQSWWLRSIDIISGHNSIQAASTNKDADKDRYKWAVNSTNALLLIYTMALDAKIVLASTWSLANIYPHMQFFMTVWNNFMMQHELGWIAIYFPTSFSNLGKSQIIFQLSTSILHLLECAYTIVQSTFETIANDHKTFPHT